MDERGVCGEAGEERELKASERDFDVEFHWDRLAAFLSRCKAIFCHCSEGRLIEQQGDWTVCRVRFVGHGAENVDIFRLSLPIDDELNDGHS